MVKRTLITESDVRNAIRNGVKVIIVDDDPIITPLAAGILSDHGIEIARSDSDSSIKSKELGLRQIGNPDETIDLAGRSKDFLLTLLRRMYRARLFEQAMSILYREKQLIGFAHLAIGQEALAVGAGAALDSQDYITISHRGHGQMIGRGSDIKKMAAELLGKVTGYCRGKGGSIHLVDLDNGVLGTAGILGASIAIATGAAMSAKIRNSGQVALTFFGDGTSNQGAFHESLNYASLHNLPVIFLCENNMYALSTGLDVSIATGSIAKRGIAFDIPTCFIDGNNVLLVYDIVKEAAELARSGGGPTLIEGLTYRHRGHHEGETVDLRPESEKEAWQKRDPIKRLEKALVSNNIIPNDQMEAIRSSMTQEIAEAIRFALESPYPDPSEAKMHVLSNQGGLHHA
ncbi:MAG: thiamine pyrophosphate-dependent enzyme [Anaerolineales bacterium]|jgi:pyruvate dehydrogenase E1 component alpha subunit